MRYKNAVRSLTHVLITVMSVMLCGCMSVNIKEADAPKEAAGSEKIEKTTETGERADDLVWGLYTESGGRASYEIYPEKLKVHIEDPGSVGHAVQLYGDGFEMRSGGKYHFSATVSSDVSRTFEWRVQVNGGDYHPYARLNNVEIGKSPKTISCDFTMYEDSDPAPRMCFNLGDEEKKQGLGGHDIIIENVSLTLENEEDTRPAEESMEQMSININQIGYLPDSNKRAVVKLDKDLPLSFDVIDIATGNSIYSGDVTEGIVGGSSGDRVGYADFSAVTTSGRYRIDVGGIGSSYEFDIAADVYDSCLKDSIRMLYLQRCGTALDEDLAGDFAHNACHVEQARIYGSDQYIDVSGGWHDAGDYGRYTVPAAKAVADLLLAYELYPDSFKDSINIPESKNGMPDVLNEAQYELDWLFKMQSDDGGVYHKVTGLVFDGFVKADECTEDLYVLPVSKTATADFAAVMYMASRVYEKFDKSYSEKCKRAADRAIASYVAQIDDRNYINPSDVHTGEYGDAISADEFLWALCEGIKSTSDPELEKLIEKVDLDRIETVEFGWDNVSSYAYFAYLTTEKAADIPFDIKERFLAHYEELKNVALTGESYGSSIADDYPWGSNMIIANNGMAFLMAYDLTGDKDYILAAQRQLDYLFGTNCTSYCFLTGYGTKSPEHPHHRPSQAIGKCMKGMLVGGADSFLDDPYARTVLAGLPKAHCYVDNEQSYSCNEITIYWNSPLVFLIAGLR